MMNHQMKINGCHNCIHRKGCPEKNNPCTIHVKDPKKEELQELPKRV